jgi:hypothetical protein
MVMERRNIFYRAARRMYRELHTAWASKSNAVIFDKVYKDRLWGIGSDPNAPFYSGIGSYDPSVNEYVALVKEIIRAYDIQSVIEVGCGDFAVASQYVDACPTYVGLDVVRGLIEHNSRKFGRPRIIFLWKDACKSKLERADLCIIRQVLQHLSNRDIQKLLGNINSKYILITEHLPSPERIKTYNLDKRSGGNIRVPAGSGVFVDKPPFNLNAKILMEKNVVSDIHSADERLVTWLVTT